MFKNNAFKNVLINNDVKKMIYTTLIKLHKIIEFVYYLNKKTRYKDIALS